MYVPFPRLIPLLIISTLVSEREVVQAKTVENRIVGKPFVSCRPEGISLVAQTEQFFEGQIYVKGARKNPSCLKQYSFTDNSTDIELKIDAEQLMRCGFKAWPKPNSSKMLISGQLIISFNRDLVTSSDRSFRTHCVVDDFQRDAYFGVDSRIQTHELVIGNFVLPEVSMSIFPSGEESLEKDSEGFNNELKVLKVGDPIIFQWKLQSTDGIFGIQLEKCSAETEDGKGMKIMENGCSLDDELISDATFSEDFSKIFANSLAFKFPEEHVVYIKCAVRTCVRRTEHLKIINGNSGDLCSMENDCGASQRNRRQLGTNSTLIHVNGRYRIEKNRMFEHLKSAPPPRHVELCMSDVIYYVGFSSVIICYLITISTTVVYVF